MAIELKPIKKATITFWIKGTSPLVQHNWSNKALEMMRKTAAERRKVKKVARNPEDEGRSAAYRTASGEYGIPAMGFKASLISAAHKDLGIEKTMVRKAFFVLCNDPGLVLPMECSDPVIREDTVRVGVSQTDLRYRPEFTCWRCKIKAHVDAELLTESDVVNLVDRAGFGVGLCEWRPEKGGDWGRYEVDTSEPVEWEVS